MDLIPNLLRQCCRRLACAVVLALGIWAASPLFGQGSDGQGSVETLPSGTYIIAMDNALQGNFNLKAYGLAVRLLHANIPLKWIINPSKGKDGVDFTASATRIAPSASAAASRSFKAGPLAIHPGYESQALTVINSFGNNVNVYQLTAAASVTVGGTVAALQVDSDIGAGATLPGNASFIRVTNSGAGTISNLMNIPNAMFAAQVAADSTHTVRVISSTGTPFFIMCTNVAPSP